MDDGFWGFLLRVERSNPVILRRIHIKSTAAGSELLDLALLSLGLSPKKYGYEKKEDLSVSVAELISNQEELRVPLTEPDRKNPESGIILTLIRDDGYGQKTEGNESLPFVTLAVGWNLPENEKTIGRVNSILNIVGQTGFCLGEDGAFYSENTLAFQERKVQSRIRKYFAPQTAGKEINTGLGLPMGMILNSIKLADLKQIAAVYEIYCDSQIRKENMVKCFCKKFDREYLRKLFDELELSEFRHFQEFVFSDSPESVRKDWDDALFPFFDRGLYSDVPKKGLRIASEVLEYYDEWCGTTEEEAFVRSKYMRTALKASAVLYGVFDPERFKALLSKLSPEEIPKEEAENYFRKFGGICRDPELRMLKNGVLYRTDSFSSKEAELFRQLMEPVWHEFCVPEKETIEKMALDNPLFSETNDKTVREWFFRYGRSMYYNLGYIRRKDRESYDMVVRELQKEGNVLKARERAERELYSLQWRSEKNTVLASLLKILEQEVKRIPLFCLNGYTGKTCPKKLMAFRMELEKQRREAEERKTTLRTATVKRTAVKKTVAVKKKRGY